MAFGWVWTPENFRCRRVCVRVLTAFVFALFVAQINNSSHLLRSIYSYRVDFGFFHSTECLHLCDQTPNILPTWNMRLNLYFLLQIKLVCIPVWKIDHFISLLYRTKSIRNSRMEWSELRSGWLLHYDSLKFYIHLNLNLMVFINSNIAASGGSYRHDKSATCSLS